MKVQVACDVCRPGLGRSLKSLSQVEASTSRCFDVQLNNPAFRSLNCFTKLERVVYSR